MQTTSGILLLVRRVYREAALDNAVRANIFEATRAARGKRNTLNRSEARFYQTEEARCLVQAASLALADTGVVTETLLRVAAVMAARCNAGVDTAEQIERAGR